MFTRRELLASMAAAQFAGALSQEPKDPGFGIEILEEPHTIAKESTRGFRLLSGLSEGDCRQHIILAPGIRNIRAQTCAELLQRVRCGARLFFESGGCFSSAQECADQADILNRAFGLGVLPPIRTAEISGRSPTYVSYSWPEQKSVRSYHAITPLVCDKSEAIAHFHGHVVCARKTIGRGGVVYLGSMLGPALYAEDREAHVLGDALMRSLRYDF